MGAAGVDVFASWAATVSATAVCMVLNSCVASAVLCAPQAVMNREAITVMTNSVYFIDLNIFSFHSVEFIILLNRNTRFFRALLY